MSHQENFRELIELLLSNRINHEQKIRLSQMMDKPGYAAELDDLLKDSFYSYSDNSQDNIDDAQAFVAAIKKKIKENERSTDIKKRDTFFYITRVAAAAFVITFAAVIYLLQTKKNGSPVTQYVIPANADIQPGTDKAVLTLSNGSTILLNDAKNGNLARQGSTNIIKQKDGNVIYTAGNVNDTIVYNTITTPAAGQYHLTLADGTRVWLDALSSINFPVSFPGKSREVKITGQAYFEVAKNAQKPFKVSVKNQVVEVLGTHFNINAYDNENLIKTTLAEGLVKIFGSGQTLVLQPNEQSQLNLSGVLKLVSNPDMEEVLAWKDGMFHYNGSNIETIMRQVARWYGVDVIYRDKILGQFVAEIPRAVPVSQLLNVLEGTKHIHFKIEGNTIVVTK